MWLGDAIPLATTLRQFAETERPPRANCNLVVKLTPLYFVPINNDVYMSLISLNDTVS